MRFGLSATLHLENCQPITTDPWASQEKAKLRILQITPEDIKGNLTINFDIYLQEK
jgi:hypothetical protein